MNNLDAKANKANVAIALCAIFFAILIYVPAFAGCGIPTTRVVNFVVWLTFLLSILAFASKLDFAITFFFFAWGIMRWVALVASSIVAFCYFMGEKLPYKEWFYASVFMGIVGAILRKYFKKIEL